MNKNSVVRLLFFQKPHFCVLFHSMADTTKDINLLQKVLFESNANVLFITGAGVSLKSGIPLYRSDRNPADPIVVISSNDDSPQPSPSGAIWERKLELLCQKRSFLNDPRSWYTYFWFDSHHVGEFLNAVPNEAHYAIGYLCSKYQGRIRLVTQNVDTLHEKAMCPPSGLIEIHGRLGLYRCSRHTCEFGHTEIATPQTMMFWDDAEEEKWLSQGDGRRAREDPELAEIYAAEKSNVKQLVKHYRIPCCPECRSPLMPLTLLFDENYQTHSFFAFDKFTTWLKEAEVVIFVGTSFSVFCTQYAINMCRYSGKTVFNINPRLDTENFAGFQDITPSRELKGSARSPLQFLFNWDSDEEGDRGETKFKNKTSDTSEFPKICHIQLKADEALMECVIPSVRQLILEKIEAVRDERERRLWRALDQ
eukprot:Gregarina_sp_Pseudo_9__544@NODE_1350_length_1670_cov_18_211527_g1261_i0_p1_GENE_NODE_1350_length_1670_cov_18_211527_g1261_i0NODE_1350_length_1670_cov_18_211527_g1261_i0_p1_ORF_typecomplete_len422_score30_71SIR2/PF02146_17/1_4e25_NODE_1350_length_1670_cov_18_211527_g1261_i03371602